LLDSELTWELHDKDDKAEGFRVFLEKMRPVIKGGLKGGMSRNLPWWNGKDTRPKSGERCKIKVVGGKRRGVAISVVEAINHPIVPSRSGHRRIPSFIFWPSGSHEQTP
jgi:hypothetical protein